MDTLEAIENRRSCRKYSTEEIDKELVGVVLNAGRLSPSAGNLQDRSFILVRNKQKRANIAEACGGQMWMQFAPVHIIVVAEVKKTKQFYGIRGERVYSIQDCAMAAQNMLLAATELGLGSCVVSSFDEDKLKTILNIEEPARPQAVITLGNCAEEPRITPKYSLEKVTWSEKYRSRIENPAMTLGIWSEIWVQTIKKAAEDLKIEERTSKLAEKLKEHGKKIKEKLKSLRKSE